jgi:hypothetical protein
MRKKKWSEGNRWFQAATNAVPVGLFVYFQIWWAAAFWAMFVLVYCFDEISIDDEE